MALKRQKFLSDVIMVFRFIVVLGNPEDLFRPSSPASPPPSPFLTVFSLPHLVPVCLSVPLIHIYLQILHVPEQVR